MTNIILLLLLFYYNNLNNITIYVLLYYRNTCWPTVSALLNTHTKGREAGEHISSFFFLVRFLPVCFLSTTFSNGQRLFSGVSITTISGYSKHTRRINPQRILVTHLLAESKPFSSTADKLAPLVYTYVYIYTIYNKSFLRSIWYFLTI